MKAWEAKKIIEQVRMERLTSQALEIAKLTHKEIDIVQWILKQTHGMMDMDQKAAILSIVAKVLTKAGEQEKGKYLLRTAFNSARLAGRESVLRTLTEGASTLAAIDQGQTLWRIYETIQEVDSWWSKK